MLRERILPTLRQALRERGDGLVAAYLFGSVARGQERADSDVDIGVVLGCRGGPTIEDLDRLADLQQHLSTLLQREVDVVPLDAASPDLRHHALQDHVLLLDGDHDARVEFEIRARNDYDDHEPFLRAYRQAVLDRT